MNLGWNSPVLVVYEGSTSGYRKRQNMKTVTLKLLVKTALGFLALQLLTGCASMQGISPASLINAPFNAANKMAGPLLDPMLQTQADAQYKELTQKSTAMPRSSAEWQKVNEISQRIIRAVDVYQKRVPVAERPFQFADTSNFQWEVSVIRSSQKNAFAMPGGKIAVYTGILPIAEDDNGLAAIIGHEVSHALLRHGRERVVKNVSLAAAMQIASTQMQDQKHAQLLKYAGIGVNLGLLLPWSRGDETEADQLGLALATIAGYDPAAAATVWKNMSAASQGSPPEFLSTHPSHSSRIRNIQGWAPQYEKTFSKYRF